MKNNILNKSKKGAASFYMVAFSTLILIIIVTSFAAVIISEVTRTANDDLSQSAYDSALAGVEDAKLVVYEYQKCLTGESENSKDRCDKIISTITPVKQSDGQSANQQVENKCSMVGELLGRIDADSVETEVKIQETSKGDNNMSQAYTCATIGFPNNLLTVLTRDNSTKIFRVKFVDDRIAENVKKVRVSWGPVQSNNTSSDYNYNYSNFNNNQVVFPAADSVPTPPTLSISMIQTASEFNLDDFTQPDDEKTNRGTLFLVPVKEEVVPDDTQDNSNFVAAKYYDEKNNLRNDINEKAFVKSNNRTARNLPYTVLCPENAATSYACSATIALPEPIKGTRNPDTFVFVVSLPYGGDPDTEVSLEFLCDEDKGCDGTESQSQQDDGEEKKEAIATVISQVVIDSTGRANDMYRRVEVRLEGDTDYPLSIKGPLELLSNDGDGDNSFVKDLSPTIECNFPEYNSECNQ